LHQSRTIVPVLSAIAISLSLVACAPASDTQSHSTDEIESVSSPTASPADSTSGRTWLFYGFGTDGISQVDIEAGTIETVSSFPTDEILEISPDNNYQVGEYSYDDVRFDLYSLGRGTGVSVDVSEIEGFSREWTIDSVFFNPAEDHTLHVVISDDGQFTVWAFDILEEPVSQATMIQEIAYADYEINRMDGTLEKPVAFTPTAEELDEGIVDLALDWEYISSEDELTASEIRTQFPNLAEDGVDVTAAYFSSAATIRLANEDRLNAYAFGMPGAEDKTTSWVTNDGVEWQFDIGDTSMVVYSRTSASDEWKKYGMTVSLAGIVDCCGYPKPSL
jgi:hypothetical protein